MVVTGGPFASISEGYGTDMILYGDKWDRGYKYHVKANKDVSLFEGGHKDKFIEGN